MNKVDSLDQFHAARAVVRRLWCKRQDETKCALRYVVDYIDEDGTTCAFEWEGFSRRDAFEAAREMGVLIIDLTDDPQ
jgi:hypothetical protein